MHHLIRLISNSTRIKDSISVGRGLYRVLQSGLTTQYSKQSWHRIHQQKIPTQPNQLKQQSTQHNQQFDKSDLKQQSQPENKKKRKIFAEDLNTIRQHVNKKVEKQQQVSQIPASRLSRLWEFIKLGKNLTQSTVQAYVATNITGSDTNPIYEQAAQKLTNSLCKMRGAPLKLAQMLSIQQDNLIPPAIRKAFEKARQSSNVIPEKEVESMMAKNLGQNWRQKFKQFGKPFAAASIGQVHKATLHNGKQVAIKIQYPGVRTSINSDLDNLSLLLRIPGIFPKGIFLDRIIKATKEELTQQCDYNFQRNSQKLYQKCLIKAFQSNQEYLLYKVPQCIDQLSTEQVLVSQLVNGISMDQIQSHPTISQQLKNQIGRRIMKLTFKELFEMGIMQSDPNPSNYTYNAQKDQLNLLDFGATHIYHTKFLRDYYSIIEGSVKQQQKKIWEASMQTGFVTGEENGMMKKNHIDSILVIGQPLRYKGLYNFGEQQITKRIYQTIPIMLKNRLKHPPQQIYSLHRKLSGSYLACIRLKAKVNCAQIFEQIKYQSIVTNLKAKQI